MWLRGFHFLLYARLTRWCDQVVLPFVEVIRSEETGGLITGMALTSLQKFVEAGMFDQVELCAQWKEQEEEARVKERKREAVVGRRASWAPLRPWPNLSTA